MTKHLWSAVAALTLVVWSPGSVEAETVKVTPLGAVAGELLNLDRALLLEDPTGVRILYDPGLTVSPTDSRLGVVHVILVSHGHGDHLGSPRLISRRSSESEFRRSPACPRLHARRVRRASASTR